MKKSLLIVIFISLLISCTQNNNTTKKSTVKEAMEVAVKYAREKFNEPRDTAAVSGIVTVEEGQVNFVTASISNVKYIIDPKKILTGLIDDDNNEDAIAYIYSVDDKGMENPENLIMIRTDGKLMLSRVIESNMKVLSVNDRIITAEVSSRSVNTPLRDCHVCKEVVKYKFKSGDLIKVQ
jgi:hypothetical protein